MSTAEWQGVLIMVPFLVGCVVLVVLAINTLLWIIENFSRWKLAVALFIIEWLIRLTVPRDRLGQAETMWKGIVRARRAREVAEHDANRDP